MKVIMRNNWIWFLFGLAFLAPDRVTGNLKTGTIWGRIFDQETHDQLEYCQIELPDLNLKVLSHRDGSFYIDSLPSGNYRINFKRVGYEEETRQTQITAYQQTQLIVELKSAPFQMDSVRVRRNAIPASHPNKGTGNCSMQVESVNRGIAQGVAFSFPYYNWGFTAKGTLRRSRDVDSPRGTLANTAMAAEDVSFGTACFRRWGAMGGAIGLYDNHYGIPGGFKGGHSRDVTIRMNRRQALSRIIVEKPMSGVERLTLTSQYRRYRHEELERSGLVALTFMVESVNSAMTVNPVTIFSSRFKSEWGASVEWMRYQIGGLSFAPDTDQQTASLYGFCGWRNDILSVEAAARFDQRVIDPDDDEEGIFNPVVGFIQRRLFHGSSLSLKTEWNWKCGLKSGVILSRAYRGPTAEELFSQGPHLAAFSYEVGNAQLNEESGLSC